MTKTDFFKILRISFYSLAGSFLLWALFASLPPLDSWDGYRTIYSRIAVIITVITLFWTVYFLWLWKLSIFQNLIIRKPCLAGTWIGYVRSDFKKNATQIEPFKIVFVIHQTFFSVRINSFTAAYAAHSFGEFFHYASDSKKIRLTYLFAQNAVLPHQIDTRQGSAELFYYGHYLAGYYWTIGKTYGFLRVHKLSNETLGSFEEAEEKYANNEVINKCYTLIANKQLDYKL